MAGYNSGTFDDRMAPSASSALSAIPTDIAGLLLVPHLYCLSPLDRILMMLMSITFCQLQNSGNQTCSACK